MQTRALLPLIAAGLLAGCGAPSPPAAAPIDGAMILDVNPSGSMPLGGLLSFSTRIPVRVTLTVGDGVSSISATPKVSRETEHELMVLGLRPGRVNTVEVTFEEEGGKRYVASSFKVDTLPLPNDVIPIDVRVSIPDRMEPGVTLIPVFNRGGPDPGYIIGVDATGDIVWYYEDPVDEPRRLMNGNLLSMGDPNERKTLFEYDMLGRTVREWYATGIAGRAPEGAIPVDVDTFHHDILETPSGTFIAIATEIRHLEAYHSKRLDQPGPEPTFIDLPPAPQDVIADRIVEFDPDTGEIIRDWKMTELLDQSRETYGTAFATGFYEPAYDDILDEPLPDWTHVNGLHYDAATDALIASVRKMSAIVKIDLGTGELDWILANPEGWSAAFADLLLEPIGDVDWTYGQHAPALTPDGNLLVFDNGSFGRSFPPESAVANNDSYSRAIEYAIDEENMTVREAWSFGGPGSEHFYSDFVSEADRLPVTGNTLVTNGGQLLTPEGDQTANQQIGRVWTSVIEVTNTSPAAKVWEIVVEHREFGIGAYRAERLPSLYPSPADTE